MTQLSDPAAEQAKSQEVIAALAQETRRSVDEVKAVYEGELARLKKNARITDYVRLFASRRTKARLSESDPHPPKDESSV